MAKNEGELEVAGYESADMLNTDELLLLSVCPCQAIKHESVPTPSSSLSLDGHYAAQLALAFGNLLGL